MNSQYIDSAIKVAPPSPVVSTEQVAAMLDTLTCTIIEHVDKPVKQGYATRAQLAEYFGYTSRHGFNYTLDELLARHSDKVRRFQSIYTTTSGSRSRSVERFCIADIEKLLLGQKKGEA